MASRSSRSPLAASFFTLLAFALAFALACGDDGGDEGGENESVVYDNGWATQGVSDSVTSTSTGITSTTGPASGSGTGSDSTASADGSTGPGEPVICTEDLTCNPGEVCVLPCCGGPAPACYSVDPGQTCQPGDTPDEGGVSCCQNEPDPEACMMMQWCIPGPCMADPPYCTPMDTITCNESSCDAPDGCYGQLNAGRLECSCK